MKLISKVRPIEIKRAFVVAQRARPIRKRGGRHLSQQEKKEFLKRVKQTKNAVIKLTEKRLDAIIADGWKKREKAYNGTVWYKAVVSPNEVGVWRRAGGLPASWTNCSLSKTAQLVARGLQSNTKRIKARSKRAIPRIIKFVDLIGEEKYLYPIVFEGGMGTKGRGWLKKMKGDIDDGCMRAIALTISGRKKINVYFGKLKAR